MNDASLLIGKTIQAVDGEIGSIDDLYFDEQTWSIRYLIADTGKWLAGRKVAIAPDAIVKPWHHQGAVNLTLTTDQIRDLDPAAESNLRSGNELAGYRVQADDGEVGQVEDILLDDDLSRILFLVVEVKGWLFGKKVLAGPSLISRVDWPASTVYVEANRQALKSAQEYNPV